MADSIEQKLINRALAVLAAIDGTGSYQTTLGSTILDGATVPSLADSRPNWNEDELPAISVFQGVVEPEGIDNEAQQVLRKMPLIFRGSLVAGTDAANARKFLSDIMRAIRAAGDKWIVADEPLAECTNEGPHGIQYEEQSFEITGVEMHIDIYYVAAHLDMDA